MGKLEIVAELLPLVGFSPENKYACIEKIITAAWEVKDNSLAGFEGYIAGVASETKLSKQKVTGDINDSICRAWVAGRLHIMEHMTGFPAQKAGIHPSPPESVEFIQKIVSHLIFCEENSIDAVALAKEISSHQYSHDTEDTELILGYAVMFLRAQGDSEAGIGSRMKEFREFVACHTGAEAAFVFKKFKNEVYCNTIFEDIIIPSRYNNMKISELAYEDMVTGKKIANALKYVQIIYAKDLSGKTKDWLIKNVRDFGRKRYDELTSALKRTICK